MEPRSLTFLAEACGGVLVGGVGEARFCGVSTDTRELGAGQAFVALRGDRFDGHDYLGKAAQTGAAAVVVEEAGGDPAGVGCAVVQVKNSRVALGRLAAVWRRQYVLPTIAVAGSNGKTTTKELLGSVLRQRFQTLKSQASYNNDIGVPLTLLQLCPRHEVAVFEVGTNHPGELAPLLGMIEPEIGVLTSLGREHLEHFGSLEGVIEEEGTLAEALGSGGTLVVNGECPGLERVKARCRGQIVQVGLGAAHDWRASEVRLGMEDVEFEVRGPEPGWDGHYRVPLLGRHQVTNALLAMAVGARLGLTPSEVTSGLAECKGMPQRMQSRFADGIWLLDDSYNANAESVLVALKTLGDVPCLGRRIAVLGDLAETGEQEEALHREMGRMAGAAKVDCLVAVGRMAETTGKAARISGLDQVEVVGDVERAVEVLQRTARSGDVVLIKASRATRLERIGEALCQRVKAA